MTMSSEAGDRTSRPDGTRARSRRRDTGAESMVSVVAETSAVESPYEAIAHRAYERFLARGGERGHDVEDWLQAEQEMRGGTGESALSIVS